MSNVALDGNVTDQNGAPVPGALVYVYEAPGTLASVYDSMGQLVTNPVTAGEDGYWQAFVPTDLVYTLRYYWGGRERRVEANIVAGTPPLGVNTDANVRADLAARDGGSRVGFAQAGTGLPATTIQPVLRQLAVHVHLFRQAGETTDTLAIGRALATGWPVRFVAAMGSDTDGAYLSSQVEVPAGAVIFGDGRKNTIIRDVNGTEGTNGTTDLYGIFSSTAPSSTTTVDYIHVSDLRFEGLVSTRAFREHRHFIVMRGVRNYTVDNCSFFGWRGDAVFIAGDFVTPTSAADYRHNVNVTIRDNVFDGDTGDNRQAVSVLDCDGLLIANNTIKNTTRSDMPGAIDIEPSPYALYFLRNLVVIGNRFANCGGNIGTIALQVPAVVTNLPVGLRIAGNTFDGNTNSGADITVQMNRTFSNADRDQDIIVTGNRGYGGARPFNVFSAKGVHLDETNVFEGYANGAIVGFTGVAGKPYRCTIKPTLKNCGFAGIQIYRGDYLTFGGRYIDTATVALFFDGVSAAGDGTTNITIRDLDTKAGGTIVVSVAASVNHSLSASTNRLLYETCELNGLAATFAAQDLRGTVTLVAGVATVTAPGVASGSRISVDPQVDGGTPGLRYAVTRTAGASFTITAKDGSNTTQTADTSTLAYEMEPAA